MVNHNENENDYKKLYYIDKTLYRPRCRYRH